MTDEQLTEVAAMEEKLATINWIVVAKHNPSFSGGDPDFAVVAGPRPMFNDRMTGMHVDDALFIAAARQFVPDAIAEIRRLRELVREAYEEGCRDTASARINRWADSEAKRTLELSDG